MFLSAKSLTAERPPERAAVLRLFHKDSVQRHAWLLSVYAWPLSEGVFISGPSEGFSSCCS